MALLAAQHEGFLEGPSGDEVSGSVKSAMEAAAAGLGADNAAELEMKKKERAGGKPGKSEYDKFKAQVNIEYRGDNMYEGKWRASRHRIEGLCTFRQGRPDPHQHRRWYSSNMPQERLRPVTTLLQTEESTALARKRAVLGTAKEVLTKRLEKEADNLKSFAYWQGKARSLFEDYKARTAEFKAGLTRIKQQLARPDDVIDTVVVSSGMAAPETYGPGAVKMDEENIRFYKEAVDGIDDDSAEFGDAEGGEKLARDDVQDFGRSVRDLSVLSDSLG